ncbi:hypothetical protein Brsp04_04568 [Brucella sp. NBRC 12952]
MLVATTNWCIELLGESDGFRDGTADNNTGTVENNGEFCICKKLCGLRNCITSATRPLKSHNLRQVYVDHMRPEITRNIYLCWSTAAPSLLDDTV